MEKKQEFINRLHEIDKRFSEALAWEGNIRTGKCKILMTPATEFYRLYKKEIEEIQEENEQLRKILGDINQLSKLN